MWITTKGTKQIREDAKNKIQKEFRFALELNIHVEKQNLALQMTET